MSIKGWGIILRPKNPVKPPDGGSTYEGGAHFHGLSNMSGDTWVEGHNAADERIRDRAAHRGRRRVSDY